MKIIGSKFWGQDSSICLLDFQKKNIFAITSDRISRIKKDNFDVGIIIDNYVDKLDNPEAIVGSFSTFDGFDTCLENKGTSYFWLNFTRILRKITKPRFYSDVIKKKNFLDKAKITFLLIFKPAFFINFFFWNYYFKKYEKGKKISLNFHKKYCIKCVKDTFKKINKKNLEPIFYDHHSCHAASAYYLSNFYFDGEPSYVLTLDQQGDHAHSTFSYFDKSKKFEISRSLTKKVKIDGKFEVISIGQIYTKFTSIMGFRENCDEGKVEALAAYGKPDEEILQILDSIIYIKTAEKDYFFESKPEKYIEYLNLNSLKNLLIKVGKENFSASIQHWLENTVTKYLNLALPKNQKNNLCLAGGVIANVILNYKIYEKCNVKNIFICPSMGDEGSALGAAIIAAIEHKLDLSWLSKYKLPYWGPSFSKEEVFNVLNKNKNNIEFIQVGEKWPEAVAEKLLKNKIIGLFQGKMEFGPRALGNRSILASATDPLMREKINLKIKKRPKFQPFCPVVLEEDRESIFNNSFNHKFMATAFTMKKDINGLYPSATHIDGTSRPQIVEKNDNNGLYKILKCIKKELGHGILINTSFNLHGRSMVMKPSDAVDDFLDSNLDYLYIEGYEVRKK